MRLAAFAVGYVVEDVSCGLLDRIEHWDRRLVLWAAGHFACAVFRHTLIVEVDATESTWDSGNG